MEGSEKVAKEKTIMQINNEILNIATPFGGMEFRRNKILFGEIETKIYAIIKYPNSVSKGWLSKISNLSNVVTCQVFEPCNNTALIEDLSRSVSRNRGIEASTRSALERQRAVKAAEDAEKLMRQIDNNNEIIGYMSNFAMIVGHDEEILVRASKVFESRVATIGCKSRLLVNQQKEGLKAISPCNVPDEEILKLTRRNVPLSSFIGGFPFASNGFTDFNGYPFAVDSMNGLVVIDTWMRLNDRTNSNWVILGVTGVGKSTTAKLLMINEFMTGTMCIVIDPEREYAELALNLGGDLINAGGGKFKINPLQFKPCPEDEDDEVYKFYKDEDGKGLSAMAIHFNSLSVFFRLYVPSITDMQMAILKRILEILYKEFNIDWDTDPMTLQAEDYPIFSDLYRIILKVKNDPANELMSAYKNEILGLEIIIRELSEGADQFIWNGHTTINPKSNFVCIDTLGLQDASDNIKKAQYYNVLTWAWERMSRDRKEKVMLFADEAYLMCDPAVPQSLIFLRNVAKRDRKYEAGLCVISHSVVDFLDPSIKMHGQAILDIACYKVIMGADGQNLIELTKLFSLTEAEQEIIANKKRKVAVFFVGSKRFVVTIQVSDYKLALMGSGGGK